MCEHSAYVRQEEWRGSVEEKQEARKKSRSKGLSKIRTETRKRERERKPDGVDANPTA